jgi:hypothetical protein
LPDACRAVELDDPQLLALEQTDFQLHQVVVADALVVEPGQRCFHFVDQACLLPRLLRQIPKHPQRHHSIQPVPLPALPLLDLKREVIQRAIYRNHLTAQDVKTGGDSGRRRLALSE